MPTVRNNGNPIKTRFHRVWDERVRAVSGGLTINPPVKGQWTNAEDGEIFTERMIPVLIACTEDQMEEIAHMTKDYYDQIKIMYYLISDKVFFV